jgi:phage-related protein
MTEKQIVWIASSYKDLMELPQKVRQFFGFGLGLAQLGDRHESAKTLKGFGGAGVVELIEHDEGGTYRAVYTVKSEEAVVVSHCFQKKSKSGIATPQTDLETIRSRLKIAEETAKELRNAKKGH